MTPSEKQALALMRESLQFCKDNAGVPGLVWECASSALAAADAVAEQGQAKPLGWYCVSSDGMATLCADEEDARQVAKESNLLWTIHGTHKAIQLCEYRDNTKQ